VYTVRSKYGRVVHRFATKREAEVFVRQMRKMQSPTEHEPKWYWYRTGEQDAANVMDPNELAEELGLTPTADQISHWLRNQQSLEDFESQNEMPKHLTTAQRQSLFDAWIAGWSSYATRAMRRT
jgi:hypothetical protein